MWSPSLSIICCCFFLKQNCCLTVDYFTHWNINNGNSAQCCVYVYVISKAFAIGMWPHTMMDMGEDELIKADFPYRFGNRQTISIRNDPGGYISCFSFPFTYILTVAVHIKSILLPNNYRSIPWDMYAIVHTYKLCMLNFFASALPHLFFCLPLNGNPCVSFIFFFFNLLLHRTPFNVAL